ncbi:Fcf2 pre-rRNA processing-domain-containing protein [Amylocystis lapponica]|nr:Fcf2 pre-rRNA processing-domain-containing protein [Amylocystis lapponica]
MALTASQKGKGISTSSERPPSEHESSSSSDSNSDSSSDSDNDEQLTQKHLEDLLRQARAHVQTARRQQPPKRRRSSSTERRIPRTGAHHLHESRHPLTVPPPSSPLPPLDPGALPAPYLTFGATRHAGPSQVHDPEVARAEQASAALAVPTAPASPPSLTNSGKPQTKRERKALKITTAGPGWFDLPAPAAADLPRLHREVEALRLRNQLDPKRFYRKDAGEGRGLKGLPTHFAIGTIVPTSTPFGTASADNLARASRKRTIVDELVDDAEAKSYAKKKFKELQAVQTAKGRGTLAKKQALRKPKW